MKILVTGGSGFLGINLIRYLINKKHSITTIDLIDFDYIDVKNKVIEVKGDIRDRETIEKAICGIDVVIHAAAALPLYSKEEIFSTDVEGTKLLLKIAYENNVKRFIHISSTAVYGIPDHHP